MEKKKVCCRCRISKLIECYQRDSRRVEGIRPYCKDCEKLSRKQPKREYSPKIARQIKNARLLRDFGITVEQYEEMYKNQKGKCLICEKICSVLDIDHCHKTLTVRGLLCNQCNQGIGLLQEDIKILQKAIDYLKVKRQVPDLFNMLLRLGRP